MDQNVKMTCESNSICENKYFLFIPDGNAILNGTARPVGIYEQTGEKARITQTLSYLLHDKLQWVFVQVHLLKRYRRRLQDTDEEMQRKLQKTIWS